jgi:hypothetical protein
MTDDTRALIHEWMTPIDYAAAKASAERAIALGFRTPENGNIYLALLALMEENARLKIVVDGFTRGSVP